MGRITIHICTFSAQGLDETLYWVKMENSKEYAAAVISKANRQLIKLRQEMKLKLLQNH